MRENNIIPIFIAFQGCYHQCVYCEQETITGQSSLVTEDEVREIIEYKYGWFKNKEDVQVAFYGGSFTAMPLKIQENLLKAVKPYIDEGKIGGIRLSTRPDAITEENLKMLKEYHVHTIELGIQSTDPEVLRQSGRRTSLESMDESSKLIHSFGIRLGLQQMIGLPGDTLEKTLKTTRDMIFWAPDFVRIYPTIVLKNTPLQKLYEEGKYHPLTLEDAVKWTALIMELYEEHQVTIARIALSPQDFMKRYIAGPIDPQFRELAASYLMTDRLLKNYLISHSKIKISGNTKDINAIVGPRQFGRNRLKEQGVEVEFERDDSKADHFILSLGNEIYRIQTR